MSHAISTAMFITAVVFAVYAVRAALYAISNQNPKQILSSGGQVPMFYTLISSLRL